MKDFGYILSKCNSILLISEFCWPNFFVFKYILHVIFLRDKTMDSKLMYNIPYIKKQNYSLNYLLKSLKIPIKIQHFKLINKKDG